jgi:peptidoglycan LD-endopeptidase LytH
MIAGTLLVAGVALWFVWLAGVPVETPEPRRGMDSARRIGSAAPEPRDQSSPASTDTAGRAPTTPWPNGPLRPIEEIERELESRELVIPVQGVRADDLVDTYNQARSEGRTHNAIDIMAPLGTPVLAAAGGTVLKLFESERGGTTVYVLDPDGRTVYYYAHLAGYAPGIAEGKPVHRGELLGYVGDTGNAGAGNTHLHFEITIVDDPRRFWSGVPVNPYPILRRSG